MRRRERMSEHMFDTYAGYIHNYICPDAEHHESIQKFKRVAFFEHGIGQIRVTALSARIVNEFRDHLRDAGLSVATTRKILATLKLVLAHAISLDMIRHNVAQGVRVIARHDELNKKVVPPTKEAMKQLLAAAEGEFRVKLLFAAMTGVRASEMHALRWRHINLDKGEVKVETRVDRYGREDITKTAAGMRAIPLGVDVIRELRAWKSRTEWHSEDDLVFPNQWGRHSNHPNMIKRDFQPLFEKLAKLHTENPAVHPPAPPRFNWHALRHFAISCWIDAELTPKTVQTFAGHSTLAVTMDRYGHLFKSDDHRIAMDAIARQFAIEEPARPEPSAEVVPETKRHDL
jgi:integrase